MYPKETDTVRKMYLSGIVTREELQVVFDEIIEKFHSGSEHRQPTEVMGFTQEEFNEYMSGRSIDEIFDNGVKSLASSKSL